MSLNPPLSNVALCAAQQNTDERETHERSSGSSKNQSVQDRRIDILPAEEDDGKLNFDKTSGDEILVIWFSNCYNYF